MSALGLMRRVVMGWSSGLAAWMCPIWFHWPRRALLLTAEAALTAPGPGAVTAPRPCWIDRASLTILLPETGCHPEEGPTRAQRHWLMASCDTFTWAALRDMSMALWNRPKCVCPWAAERLVGATMSCWWTISGGNSRECKCSTTCTSPQAGSGRTCPLLAPPLQRRLPMPTAFPIPRCISPVLHLLTVPWSSEDPKLSCAGSKSPEPNLVDPLFHCSNIPRMPSCCQRMSLPFLPLARPHPPSPTCTPTRLNCLAPPSAADPHSSLSRPQKTQRETYIKPWLWRDWGTGTWETPWAILLLPQRATRRGSLACRTPTHWCTRPSLFKVNQPFTGLRYPSQPASMVTRCMEGQYFCFCILLLCVFHTCIVCLLVGITISVVSWNSYTEIIITC